MPTSWWERWKERGKFFDQDGRPTEGREVWCELEESLEDGVQHYRHKLEKGVFGEEETRAILTLVRQMLKFEPEEQPTIQQVLEYQALEKLTVYLGNEILGQTAPHGPGVTINESDCGQDA
ncbi:hypothetical protein PENNAL_c0060G02812 [Penicillium nalgiovense]|uniref:Protein kinase domain-containing protein n=1 Tax=Penicillium nalgiovense TaxID=60175 RepID=A0A1V6XQU4_PENNA|nr:hypothetical protein PENNAL_c0060G02812 [Penicillium nalgiovense]